MMKTLWILTMVLTAGIAAKAADPAEIEAKKREVASLRAHLDHADLYFGAFAYIDKQFFRGEKGLADQVEAFNQKAADWIAGWKALMQANDLLGQSQAGNLASLMTVITERLRQQRELFNELEQIERNIRALGNLIPEAYEEVAAPRKANFANQYQPFVTELVNQMTGMKKLATTLSEKVQANLGRLAEVIGPSEFKFREALKNAIAAQGILNLQQAIAAVNQVLLTDKYVGQATSVMKALYEQGDLYARRRMIFHLRDHLIKMEEEAERLKAAASGAGLSGALLGDVQLVTNQYVNELRADKESLEDDSDSYLVYRAARKLKREFEDACEANEAGVNCILLNDLAKITEDQVEAMSAKDLRTFEMAWDMVGSVR